MLTASLLFLPATNNFLSPHRPHRSTPKQPVNTIRFQVTSCRRLETTLRTTAP
ncbi:hypothetical protein OIU79_030329 [Salix purpurea]|uniref:Uncharacterized protein n=1 Tax=Salix purpurea TaxID=77065 RepID=A0A9Q0ZRF5_SALPP|nr:hypothetical protein OIU79_030329 [Salix purpurea]